MGGREMVWGVAGGMGGVGVSIASDWHMEVVTKGGVC